MHLISSELLFMCTATFVLFPGCWRTSEALKLIRSPGDQSVVIGFNSSLVRLRWTFDLEGKGFDRLKIYRSSNRDLSNKITLYVSVRTPKILAGYEDRMNVTYFVDNGIVSVTFVIHTVTNSDESYYEVAVEDTEYNEEENTIFIDVKAHPKINGVDAIPENKSVIAGDRVWLFCSATGSPPPIVRWSKVGDSSLVFPIGPWLNFTANSSHNGVFRCTATSVGSVYQNVPLQVKYKPSRAVITAEPSAEVIAGETLKLTCKADGNPPPDKFEWKQNGEIIHMNNNTYRVLVISTATTATSGTYSCKTRNDLGIATGKKHITVKPNKCTQDSCNGKGQCTIVKGVATCECNEYWRGSDCGVSRCQFDDHCENKVKQGYLERVSGRITLLADYRTEINTKNSTEYIEFSKKVLLSLAKEAKAKAGSITDLEPGSVIVKFMLYYDKGTTKEEMENLVRNAVKSGKLANYSVERESLRFAVLEDVKPTQNPDNIMSIIVVVVVIVALLVTLIVAVAVWRVRKKRDHKDIKAVEANGEDHKMEEIPLSDPSVEAGKGPTDAEVTNKKRPRKKTDYLYTEDDVSKKSKKKKKKPEEIMYTDLADFEPEAAAQSAQPGAGQQPIRKPQQHQGTDYASITDVLKTGEGGEAEKVPISRPATCSEPPARPKGEKPV